MKRRSIWLVLGLLVAAVVFALTGCRKDEETTYSISETEIVLKVGETKELTISPAPDGTVSWQSSDTDVATVADGVVTAVKEGTATVTATLVGVDDPLTCTVTVEKEPEIVGGGYYLDFSSVALKTGETKQISVLDDEDKPVQSVTYSSDDSAVATVSENGTITAVAVGNTKIKATVDGQVLVCDVTVAQKYSYSLDKTSLDLAAGAIGKLTLITTPEIAEGARPHTFSSSDTNVATVDGGSGKVTGVGKGSAVITCMVDGEELKATVTVTEYTVKIGGEVMTAETTLRVGENKDVTVTADPDREFTPVFASGDESVLTVTDGHIVPLKAGTTSITVSVGGREFKTTATVRSEILYTINHEEIKLSLSADNNTEQLVVTRDPEGSFEATFESSDTNVVTVDANGLVTAKGIGTATITTQVTGTDVTFETSVSVVLSATLAHEDYTFGSGSVNLTYLDANKTIDWRQYHTSETFTSPARMKNNANLIGDLDKGGSTDEAFWDYKAPVFVEDAEGAKSFGVYTYGRAVHGSFSVPVKVTNAVSKIVILTGSWKETATIEFKIGDTVIQSEKFVGGDNALARKYELTIDTSSLAEGESLDLTVAVKCNREHDGNVSIVGVAVVGKVAHEKAFTATVTGQATKDVTGEQNLTAIGGIDWVSANGTKKAGVPADAVIDVSGIEYNPKKGTEHNYPGATFNWTDGTAAAPANLKTFSFADNSVKIPVRLDKGKSAVTVFATGWNCGYLVAMYDKNGNFLNGYQGADELKGKSVSSKIVFAVDAEEAGDYTVMITKCRGAGNCGWAAVAVSGANDFEPEHVSYDLSAGEEAIVTLVGEGTAPALTLATDDAEIASVENGKITGHKAGSTFVTVSYAGVERRVFVTVTEYLITSDTEISMFIGAKSTITVESNPKGHAFEATYHLADGEDKIVVSEDGVITALKGGNATVTVKVDGKTIGTITVSIADFELNETSYKIVSASGNNTFKLEVINPADGGAVDVSEVTFESQDEKIVTVAADGTVTAVGVGKTTVTATYRDVILSCEIEACILPVTTDVTDYANGTDNTVNLSQLDKTKQTLDWHYFGDGFTDEMKGGNLIGELTGTRAAYFYDYRVKMNWSDGTARESSFTDLTNGWTFKQSASFTVTLTDKTEYIAIFTGAWHAKNTIEVKIGDQVHTVYEFSNRANDESADKNKQFRIYPDVTEMKTPQTVTVTLTCGAEPDNGWKDNISLIAIAVVGKDARTAKTAGTASAEVTAFGDIQEEVIDLTAVGTLDWVYVKNGDGGDMTRKAGLPANSVIKANEIKYLGTGDGYAVLDTKHFTWSDGVDAVSNEKVNNFKWVNGKYYVPVRLPAGENEVTMYLSGWKCSYFVTVLDGFGNKLIDAERLVEGNGSTSQAVAVKFTVNATETNTFTFILNKEGGGDDSNHGWAAIAVAQKTAYSVVKSQFNATLGGNAAGKIEILKDGSANTDEASFVSGNAAVATVAADGTITAVGRGSTIVTVTVGNTELFVFVTVTEYVLESSDSVTLPFGATSQIEITANPEKAADATFASSDSNIASVSESGLITAGSTAGEATITVTIDGKTLTVSVKVVEYRLDQTNVELHVGSSTGNTKTIKMMNNDTEVTTGVTFESVNPEIATVDENGNVTAVAIGKTKVKATITEFNIVLECEVVCSISMTADAIDYAKDTDNTVNLTTLDETKETLDWRYFGIDNYTDRMQGGSLLGEVTGDRQNTFYDYRVKMNWSNGTTKETCYADYTNGWTYSSISFDVTLTSDVAYLAIFTGAWHAKNTVEVKHGDQVYATYEFSNRGDNGDVDKNKQVRFIPDVADLTTPQTVTVTLTCGQEPDHNWHDNISLVAIAVVGKNARPVLTNTAEVKSVTPLGDLEVESVDLTSVGTLDWVYAKNGNDRSLTRKSGVAENSIIKANEILTFGGDGYDFIGGKQFTWTDGVQAPAAATVNNFQWINEKYYIPVHLPAGKSEVTLYLSGWKCSYFVTVLDRFGAKLVDAHRIVTGDRDNSQAVEVKISIEATEESTFTFLMTKDGDGNHGWAAVAVAALPADDQS